MVFNIIMYDNCVEKTSIRAPRVVVRYGQSGM